MSIIERAMSRLMRGETVKETPPPPQSLPSLEHDEKDAEVSSEQKDAVRTSIILPVVQEALSPQPRPQQPPPSAPISTPPRRPTDNELPNSPHINVDLNRLAARGFLVPGQELDQKSEEYQRIKRRLLGNMVPGILQSHAPTNLIMVTSSLPGEGKTFSSLNLAVSIAMEMDRTVLLVDTDIIKADLTRLFEAEDRLGLFDFLSRTDVTVPDILLRTNIPKLVLLPAGTISQIATEKLASDAMRRLAVELANRYPDRVVVFDSPPVLAASGAVALAEHVGQIVMVVEAGKTTQETLSHALDAFGTVAITGLILNKGKQVAASDEYGYGYGYYLYGKKN